MRNTISPRRVAVKNPIDGHVMTLSSVERMIASEGHRYGELQSRLLRTSFMYFFGATFLTLIQVNRATANVTLSERQSHDEQT